MNEEVELDCDLTRLAQSTRRRSVNDISATAMAEKQEMRDRKDSSPEINESFQKHHGISIFLEL